MTRDELLERVWTNHFIHCISDLHFELCESRFEGEAREGLFLSSNGQGDHHAFAWDATGVVALAFDHENGAETEAALPQDQRRPRRWFAAAPAELAPLIDRLLAWGARDGLTTAALWLAVGAKGASSKGHSEQLTAYLGAADPTGLWAELGSISAEHAEIARRLAAGVAKGRQELSEADGRALLTAPMDLAGVVPSVSAVERAVAAFAASGVDWPGGLEAVTRRRSEDPEGGSALIEATFAGDVERVRALLEQGANVDQRAAAKQLPAPFQSGGDTPLTLAAHRGDLTLLGLLLDAGADPNARGYVHTAVAAAANAGHRDACDLLLSRGATVDLGSFFCGALEGGDARVVELALDLGASTAMSPFWAAKLTAIVERSGRTDLLERCRTGA